jgi:hypothetical protein
MDQEQCDWEREAYLITYALVKFFGPVKGTAYANQFLSPVERDVLFNAVRQTQDSWAQASDELAASEHEGDRAMGRAIEKSNDQLDVIRKKLGDTWEPAPGYKAPNSPKGLE